MRIGLLGCGNIGQFLLSSINDDKLVEDGSIVSVYSRNLERTEKIARKYGAKAYEDVGSFLNSDLDLVVEVATIEFIKEVAPKVINKKIDLLFSSIGAFGDDEFLKEIIESSNESGVNIYIPSGAIGSLDILKSSKALGELEYVSVTTRKPPEALPAEKQVNEEVEMFSGNAKQAIQLFPRNMNIAIAVSLAGLGAEQTDVTVIADPSVSKNQHTIHAKGAFGEYTIDIVNEPMPSNPKTSFLAALSVLSSIQHKNNNFYIG